MAKDVISLILTESPFWVPETEEEQVLFQEGIRRLKKQRWGKPYIKVTDGRIELNRQGVLALKAGLTRFVQDNPPDSLNIEGVEVKMQ